ncbi:MAG: ribonuclease J [Terriglobia bacterium]
MARRRKKKTRAQLRLIPLGGVGEIGKNMMVVEFGDEMIVIDTGLMFPQEEMLGIDLVLPNFSYLKKHSDKLKAIVLTHGHEDHTGALPYVLKEVQAPVFGTKLTLGLVRNKLEDYGLKGDLRVVQAGDKLSFKHFRVEFIQVCHSIPDGVGLAIHTPHGLIVHSGDFKLDRSPIDGRPTNINKFAALGRKKVLALLSDSTNAEQRGATREERAVGKVLKDIFLESRGKVVVASFASHIHRIQQVINTARDTGRNVVVTGRSMLDNVKVASELGYLKVPDGLILDVYGLKSHNPKKLAVLCTGSQGEPLSALARMASHDHRWIKIKPGDTVIISAKAVPGNESTVYRTINQLYKCGAEVYHHGISDVHASGHATRDELKLLLESVKPKYFVPIHGEFRHQKHHADIAVEVGVPRKNVFMLENGEVVEFNGDSARRAGEVEAGVVYVDGLGVGDIQDIVLRDRQLLSKDGIFIVVLTINEQTGELTQEPDVISRGVVYVRASSELIEQVKKNIKKVLRKTAKEKITDWGVLKYEVRNSLSKFIYGKLQRRPMIIPIIVEI